MDSNTKVRPRLIKLEKAFKLAEMWADRMSGSPGGDQNELEFIGRPERVGLGAKITPNARTTSSADPVERKLQGTLKAIKKKSSRNSEKASPAKQNGPSDNEDDDDDDDEPDSRIKALTKRRTQPAVTPGQSAKRLK